MATNGTNPSRWWHEPFGVVQTNLREIDAGMDVDAVAEWVQNFGATAWLCGVGGIQAQYPSSLPFHTRNPHLAERKSGDLVGDALAAAHLRGLKFLARMDFSKVAAHVAAEHLEWCYISPEGKLQEHTGGLVSVCPSGDYYQKYIFDILDEVTSRYKIDGLFFNWATMNEKDYFLHYHGVCHCMSCQSRWLDFAGQMKMPKGPDDANYNTWLMFGRQIIDNIAARIRSFLASRLPDAALIRGKTSDIIYQESNNEIGREPWHHGSSESVSSWISFRPEVPVLANSTCFLDKTYRMAGEEPAHFAQYLIQCISRGGTPSTYMMGTPGKIPYPCLGVAEEVTKFHRKWSDIYTGMQPCAKTGLVRPSRLAMNSQDFQNALSEFRGLYTSLQEFHIPFDIVGMEHLNEMETNGSLERYETLVLPDLGSLESEAIDIFDTWTARGGTLVATGSTGHTEGGSIQLKCVPAKRVLATVKEGESSWSTYVAPPQKTAGIHYYNGPTIPLCSDFYYLDWKEGSCREYKILARGAFAPPEKAYGNLEINQPGYVVASYGSGNCVVIPFAVGRSYRQIGLSCLRNFFIEAVKKHVPAEKLSFDIAEQVEVTVHKTGQRTVVHLVNMSGARTTNFGPHLPIPGGSIEVSGGGIIKAFALKADKALDVVNGKIELPTLGLYEVVVIDGVTDE